MKTKIDFVQTGDPRKGKSWAKIVTGIDKTKEMGFSIIGSWLKTGQYELEEGTVIISVGIEGSWKNGFLVANIYVVNEKYENGLEFIEDYSYSRKFVDIQNKLIELLIKKIEILEK